MRAKGPTQIPRITADEEKASVRSVKSKEHLHTQGKWVTDSYSSGS